VVNKGLDRNACSFETGFAAHAVGIDPDDFIKLSFGSSIMVAGYSKFVGCATGPGSASIARLLATANIS
jgi:hypothetical protein